MKCSVRWDFLLLLVLVYFFELHCASPIIKYFVNNFLFGFSLEYGIWPFYIYYWLQNLLVAILWAEMTIFLDILKFLRRFVSNLNLLIFNLWSIICTHYVILRFWVYVFRSILILKWFFLDSLKIFNSRATILVIYFLISFIHNILSIEKIL